MLAEPKSTFCRTSVNLASMHIRIIFGSHSRNLGNIDLYTRVAWRIATLLRFVNVCHYASRSKPHFACNHKNIVSNTAIAAPSNSPEHLKCGQIGPSSNCLDTGARACPAVLTLSQHPKGAHTQLIVARRKHANPCLLQSSPLL